MPGNAKKEDVVQKNVLCSETKVQLGSEFQPGRMGLVYDLAMVLQRPWPSNVRQISPKDLKGNMVDKIERV